MFSFRYGDLLLGCVHLRKDFLAPQWARLTEAGDMWQRPRSIGHTRSCLACSDSVQGTNELHRICRILSYCLPYVSTLQFRNLLLYKLFCCCPSWAAKIPVFSCHFPKVDVKHIITSLDIENYTWTDIQAGFVWFVKWQDAEGMETAGWISKGRSDVKNCAALSELFIAKWNNCEGYLVNNLNFMTLSSPVECQTKKSLCHALFMD